ncbi:MAG: sulfite oxidase [Pseudomonadota bacterium]
MKRERGLHELYRDDPARAEQQLFGRRRFLSHLGGMASVLCAEVVFGRYMPRGLIPAALAETTEPFAIAGKDPGLIVLNDRPLNAETPAHLLDDPVTPANRLFVRNNGTPPVDVDPANWVLTIDGEVVDKPLRYSLADLKARFKAYTYQLTIECGGNGRSEFDPPASGNQWTTGAVGSPRWTGVRLRDVLRASGLKDTAQYIGYYGADTHLSGDPGKVPISRGVPIAKAMDKYSLIAWSMNGNDIPPLHGHPLRVVFGGWPASTSGKWLTRISVRDRVHDGPKMGGYSYRVPCEPVAPGSDVPESDMCIIESMPVKSLVTWPKSGWVQTQGKTLELRGQAWAGDLAVADVDVSIDFGQTWQPARVNKPANKLAWQQWSMPVEFPGPGYYEVWARATDTSGIAQPMVVPGWNPKGYLNNATHRIGVKVV